LLTWTSFVVEYAKIKKEQHLWIILVSIQKVVMQQLWL
jgi:hypothetical protein